VTHSADNDAPLDPPYLDVPTRPIICRRCGAVVDAGFVPEHDRFHDTRVIPPVVTE
jgi:hypothetical protein